MYIRLTIKNNRRFAKIKYRFTEKDLKRLIYSANIAIRLLRQMHIQHIPVNHITTNGNIHLSKYY